MIPERSAILALRICLVALFAALLMLQFFSFPGQFAYLAQEDPDAAPWRWPLTVLAGFWLLCIEVVVVCTWRLLSLVRDDRIFSDAAMAWVDGIVWAIGAAWVVLAVVFLWVGFRADDPEGPLLLFVLTVGGAVVGLLMVVIRALLRRATTLRTDMDAVI